MWRRVEPQEGAGASWLRAHHPILAGPRQERKGGVEKGSGFSVPAVPVEVEDFKAFIFNGNQKNEIHSIPWQGILARGEQKCHRMSPG